MPWPFAKRVITAIPKIPPRRYASAASVAAIGMILSVLAWQQAESRRQHELEVMLGNMADRSTDAIEYLMQRDVGSVSEFGEIWHTFSPDRGSTWPVEAGIVLNQVSSVRWLAWFASDTSAPSFVGRDTASMMPDEALAQARFQLRSTAKAYHENWTDAYEYQAFLPQRSLTGSIGVVVGEFRIDSLWLASQPAMTGIRTCRLYAPDGHAITLRALPDSLAPDWMRIRRSMTAPSGSTLTVEWTPSDEFVKQLLTPWPLLFLVVGGGLSLALAAMLISFLRQRDYAIALRASNRELDSRLTELSKRDRQLSEFNEQLGASVQQRTAELSRALREVETFNHSVSHDLRSPVGAILNFAAVLSEDYGNQLDPEGRRFLERIAASAARANQLLDALADYTSSDSPRDTNQLLDMHAIAERAYAEAAGRDGAGAEVRFILEALPRALGDPDLVHRVFVNLLGNALKYSRERSDREIHIRGTEQAGECTYCVQDNGCGFEPSQTAEIFEPFRRLHGTQIEGSGLGLAIVAKSVQRLGGRVWAESDGESGATFYFTLPRQKENERE